MIPQHNTYSLNIFSMFHLSPPDQSKNFHSLKILKPFLVLKYLVFITFLWNKICKNKIKNLSLTMVFTAVSVSQSVRLLIQILAATWRTRRAVCLLSVLIKPEHDNRQPASSTPLLSLLFSPLLWVFSFLSTNVSHVGDFTQNEVIMTARLCNEKGSWDKRADSPEGLGGWWCSRCILWASGPWWESGPSPSNWQASRQLRPTATVSCNESSDQSLRGESEGNYTLCVIIKYFIISTSHTIHYPVWRQNKQISARQGRPIVSSNMSLWLWLCPRQTQSQI